jgi:type VI secretion system VasD/TssJ family lipoprotein
MIRRATLPTCLFFGGSLVLATVMLRCSKPSAQPVQEAKAIPIELRLEAGPRINLDSRGNPLSVVVRTYQLKDLAEFSKLTVERASSDRPAAELVGQDLVATSEFTVVPGATALRTESLKPETQYLAVVALFRQPDPQFWRVALAAKSLRPAPPVQEKKGFFGGSSAPKAAEPQAKTVVLKVNENSIAVEGIAYVPLPGQPATR